MEKEDFYKWVNSNFKYEKSSFINSLRDSGFTVLKQIVPYRFVINIIPLSNDKSFVVSIEFLDESFYSYSDYKDFKYFRITLSVSNNKEIPLVSIIIDDIESLSFNILKLLELRCDDSIISKLKTIEFENLRGEVVF